MLTGGITTAVSTNVDALIENAGDQLFGNVAMGVSAAALATLPPNKSPLLKVHGCWSEPLGTIWAPHQVDTEPVRSKLEECSRWLEMKLQDRDILIVGFWTDWSYLNQVLERVLGRVTPSRVVVVDPCDTNTLRSKAPALYDLGRRARVEFFHVRESGDKFLDGVRASFSRAYIRQVLRAGLFAYEADRQDVDATWLEPAETDSTILWQIRRDLEGCNPNEPGQQLEPPEEPLLGMTVLQLRARGAVPDGRYWNMDGRIVRVLRTANRPLHEVQAAFARESAPAAAAHVTIAVGAELIGTPANIVRGLGNGTIARGTTGLWYSRIDAIRELGL